MCLPPILKKVKVGIGGLFVLAYGAERVIIGMLAFICFMLVFQISYMIIFK
ncbi:hypothetical protein AALA78_15420 [Lachnospiraceae bacterium 42-17]